MKSKTFFNIGLGFLGYYIIDWFLREIGVEMNKITGLMGYITIVNMSLLFFVFSIYLRIDEHLKSKS